jgi:small-conductance mechanosensitive channel
MQIFSAFIGVLNGTASAILTSYVAAVVILLLGFIAARMVGILSKTILKRFGLNRLVQQSIGVKFSIEEILNTLFVYFIYFITIIMALNQIGIATQIAQAIAIGVIIIVIISVIIAIKDFVPNIIAGLYILHMWHLKKGDFVEFDNSKGKIIELTLLDTRIETPEKDSLIIPNTTMYKKVVRVKNPKYSRAAN